MFLRRLNAWVLVALVSLSGIAQAAVLPGPLVTPEWLAANADKVTVLDVRDYPEEYRGAPRFETDSTGKKTLVEVGGHIPGALLVDFAKIRAARVIDGRKISGMVLEASALEQLMRQVGVKAGQPIVIASTGNTIEDFDGAARLYWTLKYYGATDLAILDGGYVRWIDEGRPTEDAAPVVATGDWSAAAPREDLFADTAEVEAASASGIQLVDATGGCSVRAHSRLACSADRFTCQTAGQWFSISHERRLPARPGWNGYRNRSTDDHLLQHGAYGSRRVVHPVGNIR
jgi:thiosulfate/3-mercaptopyruvate sulfurtransferase